jgi:hypothetical protein
MFGPWDRSSTATDAPDAERSPMVELHSPEDEGDLLLLRSVLDAAGLCYFVKGDLFGSLTVGPRIDHYNRKRLYVHRHDAEEARELVAEFLAKTTRPAETAARELRGRDVLRMLVELLVFGWFMPGRRSRPAPPPELRVIRGGRPDDGTDPAD